MPYVDAAGLALHYERYGRGPEPVVLLHGNFASARWWGPFASRLPERYTAYAVDLRGCGESDRPDDGFGIPRLAHDVHLVASALQLRDFHLLGHSLGGAAALQLAIDHPSTLRTLTLVAPSPADGLDGLKKGRGETARLLKYWDPQHRASMNVFSVMLQWSRSTGVSRQRVGESLRGMMPTADLSADELDRLVDDAELLTPQTVIGFYRALHRWDVRHRLAQVRVPTKIIGGERDPIVPRAALTVMADQLPHGELEMWADVGHSPQLESPDRLVEAFDRFARAHGRGGWVRWWPGRRLRARLIPERPGPVRVPSPKDC